MGMVSRGQRVARRGASGVRGLRNNYLSSDLRIGSHSKIDKLIAMSASSAAIGFHIYIDESGDEGFVFNADGSGSSRWFVLSAVITRKATDLATVKLVDEVRIILGRTATQALHFRHLRHEQRLPYLALIARSDLCTVSVLIHKPSIRPEDRSSEKYSLYRRATRHLLERVSWYCRRNAKNDALRAKVIFSNRDSMSYDELRGYLHQLKNDGCAGSGDIDSADINWAVIDPDKIVAFQHDKLMGLQIADAVASGLWNGVEKNRLGFTEPRYTSMLLPVIYSENGDVRGWGMEFWPAAEEGPLRACPEIEPIIAMLDPSRLR
jgi:Protein of unknown function (DUF3800)